jgi:predicted transcriptional regulator
MTEDATLADVRARICVMMQVDAGLRELNQGQSIPHEQVKERIARWNAE